MPFLKYCAARIAKKEREYSRDIYITDALQICGENIAARSGGKYLKRRWADLATPRKNVDMRDGAEIAADVIKGCGLEVIEE